MDCDADRAGVLTVLITCCSYGHKDGVNAFVLAKAMRAVLRMSDLQTRKAMLQTEYSLLLVMLLKYRHADARCRPNTEFRPHSLGGSQGPCSCWMPVSKAFTKPSATTTSQSDTAPTAAPSDEVHPQHTVARMSVWPERHVAYATCCLDFPPLRQLLKDGAHHLLVVKGQRRQLADREPLRVSCIVLQARQLGKSYTNTQHMTGSPGMSAR